MSCFVIRRDALATLSIYQFKKRLVKKKKDKHVSGNCQSQLPVAPLHQQKGFKVMDSDRDSEL